MDERIIDFITSDYALAICRPYVLTQYKTYDFFIHSPWSIKKLYWKHMHELIVETIRQKIHEEFSLDYATLCDTIDIELVNKLNPKLFEMETYK